ncbi:hypothetical protein HED50_18630 [Ochrobactrum oryzae]|nr:hypothetical protein [Brucella oryzae]
MTDPVPAEDAEAHNRALLVAFQGGAGTIDVSRLLRLPGTVNWLSDRKRATGREPAKAFLMEPISFSVEPRNYTLADFRLRLDKSNAPKTDGKALTNLDDIEALPLPDDRGEIIPLDPVWSEVIVTGRIRPTRTTSLAPNWFCGGSLAARSQCRAGSCRIDPDQPRSWHQRSRPGKSQSAALCPSSGCAGDGSHRSARAGWPKVDEHGHPAAHEPENVRFALATLDVDARRNMFTHFDEVTGLGLEGRDISDICEILCSMFERKLDFRARVTVIRRELITIAYERAYHPVIDYLDRLIWDGVPRLDTWLRDYCEADDTELNREFGVRFLIGGVRRIKQPGVKFDTMLVLEGRQGVGKSRLAARLAVRDEWFCGDLNLSADAKTKAELVSRAWIVECQEPDGARKATLDAIKAFLATPIDLPMRTLPVPFPGIALLSAPPTKTPICATRLETGDTGRSRLAASIWTLSAATSISYGPKLLYGSKPESQSYCPGIYGRLPTNFRPAA